MKRRIAGAFMAIAFALGCHPIEGDLDVRESFQLKDRNGFRKTIYRGNYRAEIDARSREVVLKLNRHGERQQFEFDIDSRTRIPEHGGRFEIPSYESGQPVDIEGYVHVDRDRSRTYRDTESCTRTVRRRVCNSRRYAADEDNVELASSTSAVTVAAASLASVVSTEASVDEERRRRPHPRPRPRPPRRDPDPRPDPRPPRRDPRPDPRPRPRPPRPRPPQCHWETRTVYGTKTIEYYYVTETRTVDIELRDNFSNDLVAQFDGRAEVDRDRIVTYRSQCY